MSHELMELAQAIVQNPKPLILIDTCSILDIIRVPIREELNAEQLIGGAQSLLENALGGKIYLAITSTVRIEYDTNLPEVQDGLKSLAEKREKQAKHYVLSTSLAGLPIAGAGPFAPDTLSGVLSQLAADIVSHTYEIEGSDACSGRAMGRVVGNQAPASKGKSEAKDCHIIEHFLELARSLRSLGFSEKIAFVTSNSNDYGKIGDLRPPLEDQFRVVDLHYVNNFRWALNLVL